jgi:hypothetical protein
MNYHNSHSLANFSFLNLSRSRCILRHKVQDGRYNGGNVCMSICIIILNDRPNYFCGIITCDLKFFNFNLHECARMLTWSKTFLKLTHFCTRYNFNFKGETGEEDNQYGQRIGIRWFDGM